MFTKVGVNIKFNKDECPREYINNDKEPSKIILELMMD